jgi:hypothetical protein
VLDPAELRAVAERFGVGEAQVRRDHLVSHVLAALPALAPGVVFFGGTALARTHLPDGRLSEDIDLYARDRREVVRRLGDDLPRALRREFPGTVWDVPPDAVRQPDPAVLLPPNGLAVRVQVLDGAAYAVWPTEERPIDVRYADVAPVTLRVPTRAAFVAMKAAAWSERAAARDLYDLWALARVGAVDGAVAATFRHGTGRRADAALFGNGPRDDWTTALAHQTATLPPVAEALAVVRAAFAALDTG